MLNDKIQKANAEISRPQKELRLRDALWRDGIRDAMRLRVAARMFRSNQRQSDWKGRTGVR